MRNEIDKPSDGLVFSLPGHAIKFPEKSSSFHVSNFVNYEKPPAIMGQRKREK